MSVTMCYKDYQEALPRGFHHSYTSIIRHINRTL